MLCEAFRTVNKKMRDKFERGDIVEATVLRWVVPPSLHYTR